MEITRDMLFKLYVEENKTTYEIAEVFGKNRQTISNKLKKFNIPIRQGGESRVDKSKIIDGSKTIPRIKTYERIGARNFNKHGSEMVVVEYNKTSDIWVEFIEHGNRVHTQWVPFCKGSVKNVYDKTVFGIGFIGEGKYKSSINGKDTIHYKVWHGMMQRCYSEKLHKKFPTYIGCSVCEEWHNFQNFAQWFDENYYEVGHQVMQLDKDILFKNNKVYSPHTCIIVPERINKLFIRHGSSRGDLPIGVYYHKNYEKYMARCNDKNGKNINIDCYDVPEDAFISYKAFKENVIKEIAEEHWGEIPLRLYEALMKYEVEITD